MALVEIKQVIAGNNPGSSDAKRMEGREPTDYMFYYSEYYQECKEDSPDRARRSLIRRLNSHLSSLPKNPLVLDIGSGRQILEYEYKRQFGKPFPCKIITLDIANLSQKQLLTDYPHIQADCSHLPLADNSVEMVISNMALDFMPPEAIQEVNRILVPDGHALFNFHHPNLIPEDLETRIEKILRKIRKKTNRNGTPRKSWLRELDVLEHHKNLRENHVLYTSVNQIKEMFARHGFKTLRACEESDLNEKWWEADMIKTAPAKLNTAQDTPKNESSIVVWERK